MRWAGRRRGRIHLAGALTLGLLLTACNGEGGEDQQTGSEDEADAGSEGEAEDPDVDADYPTRDITWIIPFEPGGGSDREFRRIQQHVEEELGVTLIPEYREGAGGAIGWTDLQRAEPDGYTVGGIVLPHIVMQPLLLDDVGFATEDFDMVAVNVESPNALFTSAENPAYESIEEFIADVEANPGQVSVGAVDYFTGTHITFAELRESEGLEINLVPTGEGATSVMAGVMGDHFPVGMVGAANIAGDENLLPLAVAGDTPYDALPDDVPTFGSLGYETTGQTAWGVAAPPGTPQEYIDILAEAILGAMAEEDIEASAQEDGLLITTVPGEEAEHMVDDWAERYGALVPVLEEDAES